MSNNPEKQKQPQQRDPAVAAYLAFGLWLPILTIGIRFYYGATSINDVFLTLAIICTLAIAWPAAWNLAFRKPAKRLRSCILTSIMGASLVSCIFVSLCTGIMLGRYTMVPVAVQFAQQDFDRLDTDHKGYLTADQLRDVWVEHNSQRAHLAELKVAEKALESGDISQATRAAALADLQKAQDEVRRSMLPDDVVQRAWAVHRDACTIGRSPAADQAAGNCTIKRDDLLQYKHTLDREFPWWAWTFSLVGVL